MKKFMVWLLALVLALSMTACGTPAAPGSDGSSEPVTQTDDTQLSTLVVDGAELGEGATTFTLKIVDADGQEITATVHTDEKTVGDALLALGVIAGEDGPYGLYINTVNGVTVDYDTDGAYWAFYVGEAYAVTGISLTDIEPGAIYALVVENAS